ncbi:MAG: hypothetical protein Kow0029_28730 [Candidatus Rifleibacteriota bacterium]
MVSKIRQIFFILLFVLPLLAINAGGYFVAGIIEHWQNSEQQQFAAQKLGELAANVDFSRHMAFFSEKFQEKISSLVAEMDVEGLRRFKWKNLVESNFRRPFPAFELWLFAGDDKNGARILFHKSSHSVSKRSMEIVYDYLLGIRSGRAWKSFEKRRNEKMLKNIFGSGSDGELLAEKHMGVVTPVIHKTIPSFLVWSSYRHVTGRNIGFFLIVRRNQDLKTAAFVMAANKVGLGSKIDGGFIRLFKTASRDVFFPEKLAGSRAFMTWRNSLGLATRDRVISWLYSDFPWNQPIEHKRLFTKVVPREKHLLFVLLPEKHNLILHDLIFSVNLFGFATIILLIVKGLLLDSWPGHSIKSRFVTVFVLAVTLPLVLYGISSVAYIFERLKADEKFLEDTLETSLLDFDAGKEQLENDYEDAFRKCVNDERILKTLAYSGLNNPSKLFEFAQKHFENKERKLPLLGQVFFDLTGNFKLKSLGNFKEKEFTSLAKFYVHNFVINLRRLAQVEEPDLKLPEYKPDQKILAAYQSFGKENYSLERELERFRGRIFRLDFGRGKIVILHQFLQSQGKNRYGFVTFWLDGDADNLVLSRISDLLSVKRPEISVAGFKNTAEGQKPAFRFDRSFNGKKLDLYKKVAEIAFNRKTSLLRIRENQTSLLAYSSKNFHNVVLVAGIDLSEKQFEHWMRMVFFCVVGLFGIVVIFLFGFGSYVLLVSPLEEIQSTFKKVKDGNFSFSGDTSRPDELGLLNRELGKMVLGLKERERLASILSGHAIEAISADGQGLRSRKMNAVVLISDIRDFTTLGEKYDPVIITEMLNLHFAQMTKIIADHGGQVYKFIGDAIEAVFVDDEKIAYSCAVRAMKAAVKMLARLEEISLQRQQKGLFTYKIGIGLSFGEIIAGETGSIDTRLEYAMIGKPFKCAESYEAFTKQLSTLPVVVDEKIAIANDSLNFVPQQCNGEHVFSLNALPTIENSLYEEPEACEGFSSESVAVFSEASTCQKKAPLKSFFVHEEKIRRFMLFVGFFCAIMSVLAVIGVQIFSNETIFQQNLQMSEDSLKNAMLKAEVGELRPLVEEYLERESDLVGNSLPWSVNGANADDLKKSGQKMIDRLRNDGIEITQFALLHKPGGVKQVEITQDWKHLIFIGDPNLENLCRTLLQRAARSLLLDSREDISDIRKRLPLLIGIDMEMSYFYNDFQARAIPLNRNGRKEFVYWQPVLLRNSDFKYDMMKKDAVKFLRTRPTADAVMTVGVLLVNVDFNSVKRSYFNILKRILEQNNIEFIIKPESGPVLRSEGFPLTAESLNSFEKTPEVHDWVFKSKELKFDGMKFGICLGLPIKAPEDYIGIKIVLLLLIAGMLFLLYFAAVKGRGIARSFSWQLRLNLLAAAIIPVTAVYTLNELNAVVRSKILVDQAKNDLVNQFEKMEQKQWLPDNLAWEEFQIITQSKELSKLIDLIDENPTSENMKRLETMICERVRQKKLSFIEMSVFSNKGWHKSVYFKQNARETQDFQRFLTSFIVDYFSDLGSKYCLAGANQGIGAAVKGEITRETGMEIFRNLFGSDAYFVLSHGLNMPLSIFAATGLANMRLIPLPSFLKPRRVVYWLFLDRRNDSLRISFEKSRSEFIHFAESKVMYGSFKGSLRGGWIPGLTNYCRWAEATKAPFSVRTAIAEMNFLVEARMGRLNEIMVFVGLIPEDKILMGVENKRQLLLFALIASIFGIIIFSNLLSADISDPIKELTRGVINVSKQNYFYRISIKREDELGMLLENFNNMAKGLLEKELMGKMVSNAAKMIAADENSLKVAEEGIRVEVTIVYISVPGFSIFLDAMSSNELIGELKDQIEKICRIIIQNGGDIDKLMGEKVLAVFYSAKDSKDAIAGALKTISEIRKAERSGELGFPVAIGMHKGEVIAGLLGFGKQRDFTVIGDSVNTAARICAKAGELPTERFLISKAVKEMITDQKIELREYGEVELKGKAETIELFQLLFPG